MTTNLYKAKGSNASGGDAKIEMLQATIEFDASQGMGEVDAACELTGTLRAVRPDGSVEEFSA